MVDIRCNFGIAVRTFRKRLGISQEELAEKSQLDRTYIGGIERGERNVSLLNIEKIAFALEVDISEIFREIEEENSHANSNNRL